MISHSKPYITSTDLIAVDDVLRSRFIGRGAKTQELEDRIAAQIEAENVLCTGSGRMALVLALKHLHSERVLLPTYSCEDLLDACAFAGCEAVPHDIGYVECEDIDTVIVVHGPMEQKPFPFLKVIHDFANVWPEDFDLKDDLAIFSFGPLKPLTGGLGGAIAGDADFDSHQTRCLSPISDINSALVLSQLQHKRTEKRLMTVRDFEEAEKHFFDCGIIVRHETGHLVHRLMGLSDDLFPNAVKRWNTTVSLPNYPDLTEDERKRIDNACRLYPV